MAARKMINQYDELGDVMYVRLKGFEGKTVVREHPNEEMVNLVVSVDNEEIVGMIITDFRVFACKYAQRTLWDNLTNALQGVFKRPGRFVRDAYDELAIAKR
jgi:hypothetical protein